MIATSRPEELSDRVRTALLSGENFLSVVSYWEVVLKSMKGKLDVGDPRSWWSNTVQQLNATPLPLNSKDVSEVVTLAPIHQDPFDRILIATAMNNDLAILTTDAEIKRYASQKLQVLM